MSAEAAPQRPTGPLGLRRTLTLWDLVFYGVVLIQPVAPMGIFGVVSQEARGHVVTTILIGLVAMLLTALSYGRMARAYPSAGSAFTYVGQELHPSLGYVTGWSMVMDYVLNPMICTILCSKLAMNYIPGVPRAAWVAFFALLFTLLNLRGIKASARTNEIVGLGLGAVVIVFIGYALRYLSGVPLSGDALTRPFYDPATFSLPVVLTGASIACLTYIGFDGISTLSEEAKNPRRDILLATVLTCLAIGILASIEVYLAQLVWGDWTGFPDVDTAFVHVAGRAGGNFLFAVMTIALLVANMGSGTGAHLGAARLLYGMGRSEALPPFFAAVEPKRRIPRNNVILIGVLTLIGGLTLSLQLAAEMLNFGAFIAFMGVNLAAFTHYWVRGGDAQAERFPDRERAIHSPASDSRMQSAQPEHRKRRGRWYNFVLPLLGFLVCLYLWLYLRWPAKVAGGLWLAVGVAYGAWKTKGFRRNLLTFEPPPE